jgi:DNA-binding IclR family transcriptional regulator
MQLDRNRRLNGKSDRLRAEVRRGSGIKVIDRAAMLLDVLAESDSPMRLHVIAERSGLTASTTRRILASLCEHGLCEQPGTGLYRLGFLLFTWGSRVERSYTILTLSRSELERLSDLTGLTVFLTLRDGSRGVALARIDGRSAFPLALTAGGSMPLHVGAAQRALLAWDLEADIRSHLAAALPLTRYTDKTPLDVDEIVAELLASRERGWALSVEDITPGVAALSAPIFAGFEKPIASITIAGLVPQILGDEMDRLVQLLRDTAEFVSRQLVALEDRVPMTGLHEASASATSRG